MFLAMETDPDIGGVCGFMGIKFQDIYTEGGERSKMTFSFILQIYFLNINNFPIYFFDFLSSKS